MWELLSPLANGASATSSWEKAGGSAAFFPCPFGFFCFKIAQLRLWLEAGLEKSFRICTILHSCYVISIDFLHESIWGAASFLPREIVQTRGNIEHRSCCNLVSWPSCLDSASPQWSTVSLRWWRNTTNTARECASSGTAQFFHFSCDLDRVWIESAVWWVFSTLFPSRPFVALRLGHSDRIESDAKARDLLGDILWPPWHPCDILWWSHNRAWELCKGAQVRNTTKEDQTALAVADLANRTMMTYSMMKYVWAQSFQPVSSYINVFLFLRPLLYSFIATFTALTSELDKTQVSATVTVCWCLLPSENSREFRARCMWMGWCDDIFAWSCIVPIVKQKPLRHVKDRHG